MPQCSAQSVDLGFKASKLVLVGSEARAWPREDKRVWGGFGAAMWHSGPCGLGLRSSTFVPSEKC